MRAVKQTFMNQCGEITRTLGIVKVKEGKFKFKQVVLK
jgi:hypothetical protein